MKSRSDIKHFVLLFIVLGIIGLLAFTLEKSEINDITKIELTGNNFLSEKEYLIYSQLNSPDHLLGISAALIRDRLAKHPYIENVDIQLIERGIATVKIYEKKIDAVLLSKSKQYMISIDSEIVPWLPSTKNINLPVIIDNYAAESIHVFDSAVSNENLLCALKIISTAKVYDNNLYQSISEINLNKGGGVSIHLSDLTSPIYFGKNNEIEKTVFLSKIYQHVKGNKITNYLDYVDLRYNEMVYLGLDELSTRDEEKIWKKILSPV